VADVALLHVRATHVLVVDHVAPSGALSTM
jgi:hypothetical protein